jgi:hypothetical protein
MANESLRSFCSQLLAVVLAGLITFTSTAAVATIDTSDLKKMQKPSQSMLTDHALRHDHYEFGWENYGKNYHPTCTDMTYTYNHLIALSNNATNMASMDLFLAKNKVAMENYYISDAEISTVRDHLNADFGFKGDYGDLQRQIRNVDRKAAVDHMISLGTKNVLVNLAENIKKGCNVAKLVHDGNMPALEAIFGKFTPDNRVPFASLELQNISRMTLMFLLPAPDCNAADAGAAGFVFLGTALNVFGGPETPWAWVGDGFLLGAAAWGFLHFIFC